MRKIKIILLTILLTISGSSVGQVVAVTPEEAVSPNGQLIVRFTNHSQYFVSCWYRDQYNYYTFSIPPGRITNWHPVFGLYQWQCRFV